MWKKHKNAILSFLLIVGMFFMGTGLPGYMNAEAAPSDKSAILTFKKIIKQDGKIINHGDKIDPNLGISVNITFDVPVKKEHLNEPETNYIEQGDTAQTEIGAGIKLTSSNAPVTVTGQNNKKIGTATFENKSGTPADGIVMKFVFDGDADVFTEYRAVKADITATFDLDISTIDPTQQIENQKITILGEQYDLQPIQDKVEIAKTGEVDYRNSSSVKWTITVTRSALGANNLSLAGYKIADDMRAFSGSVKDNSFKLNGNIVSPKPAESGNILNYEFPAGTQSPAVITFNTAMTSDQFIKEYKATNTVELKKIDNTTIGTASAAVDWTADFGEKTVKKHDNNDYDKVSNEYFIDWEITFNNKEENFTNVKIKDELPKDNA